MTRLCQKAASARQVARREFLQTSGMLVASVAAMSVEGVEALLRSTAATGPYPDLDYLQLDS